jgi:hypothetical protein
LNKPLLHTDHAAQFKHRRFLKPFLRLLIAAQWGLILVASAEQNWDAILISIGIIFCAYTSSFIFRTSDSIASWLTSNHVGIEKMSATFTGRRAMLSAMLAVNPDRQNDGSLRTDWLDPILKPSADRVKWVQQLQRRLFDNVEPDADGMPFLIDFIKEGVQKASYINEWLLRREKYHNVPTRPDPQTPVIITPPKSLQ